MAERDILYYVAAIALLTALLTSDIKETDKTRLTVRNNQSALELDLADIHISKAFVELYDPNGDPQTAIEEYEKAANFLNNPANYDQGRLLMIYRNLRDLYEDTGNTEKSKEMAEALKNL